MKPTREEIHAELSTWHPTSRLARVFREARVCEVKNGDGDIIEAYEYEGAYYDRSGVRLESEWIEYKDWTKSIAFRVCIALLLIFVVFIPAILDLKIFSE